MIGSSISSDVFEFLDTLFEQLYLTVQQQIKLFKRGKLHSVENWTFFIDLSCGEEASVTELCNTPILNAILDFFEKVFACVGTQDSVQSRHCRHVTCRTATRCITS